jgi:hypothetical protein
MELIANVADQSFKPSVKIWDVPSQVEKALLTLLDDGLIEERRKNTYSLPR